MLGKPPHTNIQECAQAGTITSIFQILEQLSSSHIEERQERRESEKRIIDALEKMADQGARIHNLESYNSDFKKDIEALYNIQQMLYTFYKLTTNKYVITLGVVLLGLLLVGSLNDLAYHTALFTALFNKLLGVLK